MHCLLPALFLALSGKGPLPYPYTQSLPVEPRKANGDGVCGTSLEQHLETEHFTLQLKNGPVEEERIIAIATVLEEGWENLVFRDGWTPPSYSKECKLWIFLDTSLNGSGITFLVKEGEQSYPVSYLNPTLYLEDDPDFILSVAVHEFGHMLQYEVEDSLGDDRMWYWEASAEWMAELGAPELDTYAESTWAYARRPELAYNSNSNQHPYGMFLLNAWMDQEVDHDAMREAWNSAREYPEEGWDLRLARVAGQDFGTMMQSFTGSYEAGTLRESSLYEKASRYASLPTVPAMEEVPLPGLYGSYYLDFGDGGKDLEVEGPVLITYVAEGEIRETPPDAGPFTAIFTATEASGTLKYGATPKDTGEKTETEPCGCSEGAAGLWLGFPVFWLRRRLSDSG